jgi:hypothetical protein
MALAITTSRTGSVSGHAIVTYPFNTRQYARLLILRSRLKDSLGEADQNAGTDWLQKAA